MYVLGSDRVYSLNIQQIFAPGILTTFGFNVEEKSYVHKIGNIPTAILLI